MDIVTLGAALSGAKKYTDDVIHGIAGGITYKGEVNYYSDLPYNPTLGDAYTVKYSGTTGTNPDGSEYVWAENGGVAQWVDFSKDSYTKAETDALLENKADLVNGTVPAAQIPPEVFERMKVVADDTARFALTTSDVQNGDIVYVDATQVMYYVYDDTKLDVEAGYKPFAAGTAAKAIADKNGNDITTTYQTKVLGSWTAGQATSHSTPDGTDTALEALEKIDNNQRLDETNISNIQQTIGDINTVLEGVL